MENIDAFMKGDLGILFAIILFGIILILPLMGFVETFNKRYEFKPSKYYMPSFVVIFTLYVLTAILFIDGVKMNYVESEYNPFVTTKEELDLKLTYFTMVIVFSVYFVFSIIYGVILGWITNIRLRRKYSRVKRQYQTKIDLYNANARSRRRFNK